MIKDPTGFNIVHFLHFAMSQTYWKVLQMKADRWLQLLI